MSGELILKLQQIVNRKSDNEDMDQIVANYLLKNSMENELTITKLANACHVSNASITRFAKNIGYNGFNELKSAYFLKQIEKKEIGIDLKVPSSKSEVSVNNNKFKNEFSQLGNIIDDFNHSISEKQIQSIVKKIYNAENVYVFATLIPGNLVQILQHVLLSFNKYVVCHPTIENQLSDAEKLTENDLALFVSLEGSHIMNRELTLQITQSKADSILITQNPDMKLGSLFDEMVTLGSHDLERSGKYKLLMFIEYLSHYYVQLCKFNNDKINN